MTSWTGRARAGATLTITAAVVVVVAIATVAVGEVLAGLALLIVVGGALLAFAAVRVTVDDEGLTVRSGTLPFVKVNFPLARIESAEAIDVNPWRWGGWGYRGSVRVFRRAAWVLRRGEGIKVNLVRKRVFVVAVDDADAGAATLQRRLV